MEKEIRLLSQQREMEAFSNLGGELKSSNFPLARGQFQKMFLLAQVLDHQVVMVNLTGDLLSYSWSQAPSPCAEGP